MTSARISIPSTAFMHDLHGNARSASLGQQLIREALIIRALGSDALKIGCLDGPKNREKFRETARMYTMYSANDVMNLTLNAREGFEKAN